MSLVALVLATGCLDAVGAETDQLTGTVVVVNQASDTVTLIDLGEFSTPHDVQWVKENQVVCTVETNKALLLVNVESGEIERVFETGKDGSHMLSLSQDQERLYSSNMSGGGSVSVFDFHSGKKITDIDTGKECEGVGVSPDGRWVWAGEIVMHGDPNCFLLWRSPHYPMFHSRQDLQAIPRAHAHLAAILKPQAGGTF
jgi:DNA-binding beta-propeller fold protein YncE